MQIGDLRFSYIEAGPADGKTLVFIHGSGTADAQGWRMNINFFADLGYRVLAPDLPGFGKTPNQSKRKCTELSHAEFINNFLDALNVEGKINIIGASAGGFTTIIYTAMNLHRVDAIVPVGSYDPKTLTDYSRPWPSILSHPRLTEYSVWIAARNRHIFRMGYKVYELVNRGQHEGFTPVSDEKIEQTRQQWKHMRRATFEFISEHKRQTKAYKSALGAIAESDVRVLFIHGGKDNLTFPESSKHAAEFLGSPFERFANSTHAPQRDNCDEFNARVISFFNERREETAAEGKARKEHRSWHSGLLWWRG